MLILIKNNYIFINKDLDNFLWFFVGLIEGCIKGEIDN